MTNWLNIAFIFIAVFIITFISAVIDDKFSIIKGLIATTYVVIGYGLLFWTGFIICILILDIALFSFNQDIKYTPLKLAIEWLFISSPFIYWLVRYNQWIFLVAVLGF